mgnify:CR=1 FL=1
MYMQVIVMYNMMVIGSENTDHPQFIKAFASSISDEQLPRK